MAAMVAPWWVRCLCVLAGVLSHSTAEEVVNPSGNCTSDEDGGRPGYASPGETDTYLPDCNAPLKREYWRVFVSSDEKAYIIPRPDAMGIEYDLCAGTSEELFKQGGLCEEAADPDVINNLEPKDALDITRALHELLVFERSGDSIKPFAPPDDVIAACDLTSNAAAKSYCQELQGQCDENGICNEMLMVPSSDAIEAIVPALNKLYGIESSSRSGSAQRSVLLVALFSAFFLG